jgi:rhombotail lipoprotein
MQESKTVWSLIFLLVTGCASHEFDRAAMRETLDVDPIPSAIPVPESQLLSDQGVHLSTPFRLGVFFMNRDFPNMQSIRKVEWLTMDREQLLRQLAPLRDERILEDIFVLMDATLRGESVRGIRQVGARYGADLVLIVDGTAAVNRRNNRYASLYPTLLGAYLVPGTESDALVMATGRLWAVRSEWHTPIQTVEGVSEVVGSTVLVEDSAALQEAKERAIQALGMRIIDQLRLLAVELPRTKPNSR